MDPSHPMMFDEEREWLPHCKSRSHQRLIKRKAREAEVALRRGFTVKSNTTEGKNKAGDVFLARRGNFNKCIGIKKGFFHFSKGREKKIWPKIWAGPRGGNRGGDEGGRGGGGGQAFSRIAE